MNKNMKINSSDRCEHCGHWAGDDKIPFVIYSKERAKWMEEAVKECYEAEGDDSWLDWVKEGKRLTKINQ